MGDLCTLAEVREWLGIDTIVTHDALLERLITAVSRWIFSYLGYEIASQSYNLVLDGHGGTRLVLARPPLTAVSSLKIDGVAIPRAADVNAAGYRFSETEVRLNGFSFNRGQGNVELACTRGYASVPPELGQAAIELTAWRFTERDRIGQESKSLQGANVTYSTKDMPASVKTVLDRWRKAAPL